jgi:hypothetical protein
MLPGDPQIANLCDWRTRFRRQLVLFIDAGVIERDVDLARFKSGDLQIDRRIHLQDIGEFQGERCRIPT